MTISLPATAPRTNQTMNELLAQAKVAVERGMSRIKEQPQIMSNSFYFELRVSITPHMIGAPPKNEDALVLFYNNQQVWFVLRKNNAGAPFWVLLLEVYCADVWIRWGRIFPKQEVTLDPLTFTQALVNDAAAPQPNPQVETCTIGVASMEEEEHQPTEQVGGEDAQDRRTFNDMALEAASQGSERIRWQPDLPTDHGPLELTIKVYDTSTDREAVEEQARVEFFGTKPVWFVKRLAHPSDGVPVWTSLLSVYGGMIGIAEATTEPQILRQFPLPPPPPSDETTSDPATALLEKALNSITNVRRKAPEDTLSCIAELWNAYLARLAQVRSHRTARNLEAHDVAIMMELANIAGLAEDPDPEESWLNTIEYAAVGRRCRQHYNSQGIA